ncbi:MAG: PAS domain S-box protein [Arthrospira sp. PLM2.Bin9]|nr:PAS domain S-box protein [Arthrospira sp. PLM2.Bin9]TVU53772.1 MAG: PAS domain S-box protein [Arthrospira sp. PLM2.Bin9]
MFSLTLNDIIHRAPLTVVPNTSVMEVMALMSQEPSDQWGTENFPPNSCVLVVENGKLVGVWTERDVVQLIGAGENPGDLIVYEVMRQPPVVLREADDPDIYTILQQFKTHKIKHIPVIDDQDYLTGIITESRLLEKIIQSSTQQEIPSRITPTTLQQQLAKFKAQLQNTNAQLQGEINQRGMIRMIEQKLRTSEPNIRTFFDALTDIILIINTRSNSIYAPPQSLQNYHQYLGKKYAGDTSKIIRQTLELFSPVETSNIFIEKVNQCLTTGKIINFEYHLNIEDNCLWFSANISPISSESVAWVARDITDHKRAESALQSLTEELEQRVQERTLELQTTNEMLTRYLQQQKESEKELLKAHKKLRSHVENSPLAVIEWSPEFKVQYWGNKAEQIFGWKAKEILGLHWGEWQMFFEEDLPSVEKVISDLLLDKTHTNICKNRNYTKDGRVIYCEWYNSVLRDESNQVISILSLVQDVTERELLEIERCQVEDALRDSEARYATLTDISPVGIFRTDAEGQSVYINERGCDLVGCSAMEMFGYGWTKMVHPDDRDRVINEWEKSVNSHQTFQLEYRFCHVDETVVWVFSQAVPELNDDEEIVGFVGTLTDISELKSAETSLQQLNQQLEMLVEQRTSQLQETNEKLRVEIAERQKIEAEIATKAYQQAMVAEVGQKALLGIDSEILIEDIVAMVARCLQVDYCKLLEIRVSEPDRLTVAIAHHKHTLNDLKTDKNHQVYSFILPESSTTPSPSHHRKLRPELSSNIYNFPHINGMSIPIESQNSYYGILGVYTTETREFVQEDVHFLQSVANVLATAIERKHAEDKLMNSLKEKEILLKEIHHRVKNNLLVVSNLLEFQSDYTDNPEVIKLLSDSQQRIQSMALIHEKLYKSTGLDRINFGDYLNDLVEQLFDSYGTEAHTVELELDIESVELNLETANPCSLIVNELISNAFKHAFVDERPGKLGLELHQDNLGIITLIIRDNGVGIPEGLDIRNVESLGMELIWTLTEQIEGNLELLEVTQGTAFKLTFSELSYRQRY